MTGDHCDRTRVVDVVCIDMDALGRDLGRLSATLSPAELDRAHRYRFERDRRRFMVRRGALRVLLSPIIRVPPAAIAIELNAWGKPRLESSPVRFNVSHAEHLALYALSEGREIGCDIAWRDASIRSDEVATAVLSDAEQRTLRAQPISRQRATFLDLWTRKEACVKALGVGLSMAPSSFEVPMEADEPTAVGWSGDDWLVQSFEPAAGFHAAIVAGGPPWRLRRSRPIVQDFDGFRTTGEQVGAPSPRNAAPPTTIMGPRDARTRT